MFPISTDLRRAEDVRRHRRDAIAMLILAAILWGALALELPLAGGAAPGPF
ncbi:MAG: hypothetical protein JO010_10180 [Alphaproteobacteria bacterium]|nr:hypothetical protein [Alphaproteobacteria bacterium]